jgi:hypothetical protein
VQRFFSVSKFYTFAELTMGHCISRKKMYPTQAIAEDALIRLWILNDYTPSNGPVNVYRCDDCGHYHLTSQGPLNKRLGDEWNSGRIRREREAQRWVDRLKK